jgi:hypothetical protein
MSLADHFAECPRCGGYELGPYARFAPSLGSRCRCPDERITAIVERDLRFTMQLESRRDQEA